MDLQTLPAHGLYMRDPDYLQDFRNRRDEERVAPGSYVLLEMVWRRFYSSTTAHGVPHYGYARGKVKKCFWAILVIAALITVLYNLVALSRDYLSYPSDNVIILNHATSLDFPAVTVCNMNPLKRSAMEARHARSHHRQKRATGDCDPDWVEYNDHCYYVSTEVFAWENASASCESRGAFLIKINDQLENNFIDSWLNPTISLHFWLGLRKESSTWIWRDGTSPIYVNWDPAGLETGLCARLTAAGDWRATSARPCSSELQFICEKDIIPAATGQTPSGLAETTKSSITSQSYLSTSTTEPGLSTSIQSTNALLTTQGEIFTTSSTILKSTESETVITTETTDIARTITGEQTDIHPHTSGISATTSSALSDSVKPTYYSNELMTTDNTVLSTTITAEQEVIHSITTSNYRSDTSFAGRTDDTSTSIDYSTAEISSSNAATSTDSFITTVAHTKSKCCCVCCSAKAVEMKNKCHQCMSDSVQKAKTCAMSKIPNIETKLKELDHIPSPEDVINIVENTQDILSSTSSDISESSAGYSSTTGESITTVPTTSEYDTLSEGTVPQSVINADSYSELNMEATSLLDEPSMSDIGYSLEELVLDCQYSGHTCDFRQFGHFVNNIHGNCYIFNSGWNNTTSRQKTRRTGRRYGLHMVLNVIQKEYPLSGSDTVGVRVVVHSRDRMPFPEDEGVTVSPGRATSISIRQVELNYLSKPHGDCIDTTINHEDINVFEEKYPVNYSSKACERTCYQRHVIQTCGCGDPSLPRTGTAVSNVSVPVCSTSNHTQAVCMTEVISQIRNSKKVCHCPKPCSSLDYTMSVSIGQWPSRVQKQTILNNLADKIGKSFSITDPKGYVDNLVKMEIFYEEFNFESIRQRPKYKSGGLLSNIGGMLGLWVGFSVFTVIELVEVLVDVALVVPYHSGQR